MHHREALTEISIHEDELHRTAFELSTDPVVVTDTAGRLLQLNRAARQLCVTELAALVDPQQTTNPDLSAFHAQLGANGHATVVVRVPVEEGPARHIALEATEHAGKRLFFVRDVSDRCALDAEVHHLRRLESVGYLSASLAHDFSNLLTPILLLSGSLAHVASATRAAEIGQEIEDIAGRAARLVRQVLSLTRRQSSRPERVNVRDALGELRTLVERVVGEDVEVVIDVDGEGSLALADAMIDREQFEHVILNLAANARDAMPDGGRLTFSIPHTDSASLEGSGDGYLSLLVTDTGTGMEPDVRARIFDQFFTTKERGHGTGIGLASVHRFVTQSGGRIAVRSAVAQGTTVAIFLPHARPEAPTVRPPRISSALPRGSETVLVVEDDERVRHAVRGVLEDQGYEVLDAGSADDGLRAAAAHPAAIDLVVSDVVMGGMNGRAFVERLRRTRSKIKALFMSGHSDETILAHGVREPGDALLRKAFSPRDLVHKVRDVLDARPLALEGVGRE